MERRGLHFLVGLAVLWLLWRLRADGLIFQAVAYTQGDLVANSPGALIASFLIEAVIAVGAVATLVASGIWDALYLVGSHGSDALQVLRGYLSGLSTDPVDPTGTVPPDSDSQPGGTNDAQGGASPGSGTVADALAALDRNVRAVDRNVAALAQRMDALEGDTDGAA